MGHDEKYNGLHGGHDGGLGDAFGILRQSGVKGLDLRALGRGRQWGRHILRDDGERGPGLLYTDDVPDEWRRDEHGRHRWRNRRCDDGRWNGQWNDGRWIGDIHVPW